MTKKEALDDASFFFFTMFTSHMNWGYDVVIYRKFL